MLAIVQLARWIAQSQTTNGCKKGLSDERTSTGLEPRQSRQTPGEELEIASDALQPSCMCMTDAMAIKEVSTNPPSGAVSTHERVLSASVQLSPLHGTVPFMQDRDASSQVSIPSRDQVLWSC